jgi:membrane-anchored protein YejM (alkaline phosphatase superfamily)
MIVWMPGSHPKAITQRTSHMDIGPTILTRLGLKNPTRDYSMGFDLATPQNHRTVIVASWSDIGLINDHGKLVIPFKSTTQHQNLATDLYDNPVNGGSLAVKMKDIILQVLADARYYQK